MNSNDLPDEFWLSIRHKSTFNNIQEYNVYLELKIKEWNAANVIKDK